jgi:hypothetical protein
MKNYKLYEYSGLFNEQDINFNTSFFILTKNIDDDSGIDENYEHVYNFIYINKYITKDIWKRVIDELPKKNTLKKLIAFESEIKEYLKQKKYISDDLIENNLPVRQSGTETKELFRVNKKDITNELNDKLNELNIKIPELKLD